MLRFVTLILLAAALPAFAQPPLESIGQPRRWLPYAAATGTVTSRDPGGFAGVAGIERPIFHPVAGLLSLAGEGYGATGGRFEGGGARLLARVPVLAIGAGVDWNAGSGRAGRIDALLTYRSAIRRGGLFGRGTMLRIDYLPTRARTLDVGIHVPLGQPLAGRTRPHATAVPLPRAGSLRAGDRLPAAAERALADVAAAAPLLRAMTSLWSEADAARLRREGTRAGGPLAATMQRYHAGLDAAFGATAGADHGPGIATRARQGLLTHVLIPFDSLFGRVKEPGDDIRGLTARAHATFVQWLADSSTVPATAHAAVRAVHARWLAVVESVHGEVLDEWRDSRFAWLPLRLALRETEFDDQPEVDSLLGRLAGRPFTDDNTLTYLRSADLPLEIARSIYAARRYHVLWTHDFAGIREETGELDALSFEMVADAYLPALTAAVRRYDSTGVLPAYVILIDQWFYEPRKGRLWMSILEDPMHAPVDLPGDEREREARLRQRQAELRAAVAASRRLQDEAGANGGERWLRARVKVHVNVTFPSDFSFRSHRIIPGIPFTPDNIMRDHRKIVLYDLDEADPYRGALLLMGVGVGEHYASATWEDRGYRLRGPAALEARAALRRVLARHGLGEDEIPAALRPVADAERVEGAANDWEFVGRALQVHNETGFGRKTSSVVRAALYDLTSPGSVVVVPDPLWLSAEWGAMLAGAAARGAHVHVISPADRNAPSAQPPLRALNHEVMVRLLALRDTLRPVLERSGGTIRVGLFAAQAHVDDAAGRRREFQAGLRRAPWLRTLFPFDDRTIAVLENAFAQVANDADDATRIARDVEPRPPQLHQKTQLIASAEAIATLLRLPGWDTIVARQMETQSRQAVRFADQLDYATPSLETEGIRRTDAMLNAYEQSLPEAARRRASFYFSAGTQNMDPRGLALDGEASIITSGFQGITGLVDLFNLMARTTWVETRGELEQHLAPRSWFWHWVARVARPAF